jgi:hypothetical protein
MNLIESVNVEHALHLGMETISQHGVPRESRAGDVLVMDGPTTVVYANPRQRVLFSPTRDANPFFHFMESLWMLDGRRDVAFPSRFNSTFEQFSDDGKVFHGAYGWRWREHFQSTDGERMIPMDQLITIAQLLRKNPDDRRVVLQMWDPEVDLAQEGKDFPCNLSILFSISIHGQLDMTVFNRSNDMLWGALGANAVHMSMLQEFMAGAVGVDVGRYWQVANNFHAYSEFFTKKAGILNEVMDTSYIDGTVEPFDMMGGVDTGVWLGELSDFLDNGAVLGYTSPFFRRVAVPMLKTWEVYKDRDNKHRFRDALKMAESIGASDWRKACTEWLERRSDV